MAMQQAGQPMSDHTKRVKVAGFDNYLEAQAAVDKLSDNKFPVQRVSIVGTDLRMVENVIGRMSWGRAALSGLGTGLWLGLMIALLLMLFSGETNSWKIIGVALVYGAAFGIIFGLIAYAFTGGKRDFVSRSAVVATSYDVLVDPEVVGQAQQLLGTAAAAPPAPSASQAPTDPQAPAAS